MAEFLASHTKATLIKLAEEFEVTLTVSDTIRKMIKAITDADEYDENFAKHRVEKIAEEEKDGREKEEAEKIREFELEKLRLMNQAEVISVNSQGSSSENVRAQKISLKDLVPKFDPKQIDITLFLLIFERQAEKINIQRMDWVSQLIPLLPIEMAELIIKEPVDLGNDYDHIKSVMLKRFRLGAGALRSRFESHQRKPGALWIDLLYELKAYMDNWLEALEIKTFEEFKELMLTEQLKKRVPLEIKEKYMDDWEELKQAREVAEKCDKYESILGNFRKTEKKVWDRKFSFESRKGLSNSFNKFIPEEKGKILGKEKKDVEKNDFHSKTLNYEKAKKNICYFRGTEGHIKPNCVEWKKHRESQGLNHVRHEIKLDEPCKVKLDDSFRPYVKTAWINGVERNYLRDSGAQLDLIDRAWVNNEDFVGETTWVKQPLDEECKCLPLAWVSITTESGSIITKAAVKPLGLEQGYYLLGNRTAELIENKKNKPSVINSITTRSQAAMKAKNKQEKCSLKQAETVLSKEENTESEVLEKNKVELAVIIPEITQTGQGTLSRISPCKFHEAQKNRVSLKPLWGKRERKRRRIQSRK